MKKRYGKKKKHKLFPQNPVKEDGPVTFEELMKMTPRSVAARNQTTFSYFLPEWLANCRLNAPTIEEATLQGACLEIIPDNGKDVTRMVLVGSGPSLNSLTKEDVNLLSKCFVVASPTNFSWCVANGLIPDVVIVLDSNRRQAQDLYRVALRKDSKTSFVLSPTASPAVFEYAEKRMFPFKAYMQSSNGTLKGTYNHFLNLLYSNIKDHLIQAGCVTNTGLIFINEYAKLKQVKLNAVYVIGCDYGYPENISRCHRYTETQEGFDLSDPADEVTPFPTQVVVQNLAQEEVLTNIQMYLYVRSFLLIFLSLDIPIFLRKGHGLLNGIFPEETIENMFTMKLDSVLYPREQVKFNAVNFLRGPKPVPKYPEELRKIESGEEKPIAKEFIESYIEKN